MKTSYNMEWCLLERRTWLRATALRGRSEKKDLPLRGRREKKGLPPAREEGLASSARRRTCLRREKKDSPPARGARRRTRPAFGARRRTRLRREKREEGLASGTRSEKKKDSPPAREEGHPIFPYGHSQTILFVCRDCPFLQRKTLLQRKMYAYYTVCIRTKSKTSTD